MHRLIDNETSTYKNLVQSAKQYGFKKNTKGKSSIHELEAFIYKNMNRVEPQSPKQKRRYDSSYYYELYCLAVENGFINNRAGKQKLTILIDFLSSKDVELPVNQVVINQHRKKLSDCNTYYDQLLFQAKELGYSQYGRLGRPSLKQLESYLQIG